MPKLTYFNGRGRAEVVRMIFAHAGVEFEDERVEQDQWPKQKARAPFGQVPFLEIDGYTLCQTNACGRYVARKYHLAGKTDLEQAQADMIVDCLFDSSLPMFRYAFEEKDETKKAEAKKKYLDETMPGYLKLLETILKANHGGEKFFVGSELTWADLTFINFVEWLVSMGGIPNPLEKFPTLAALDDRVRKVPKIAAWIEKRPKTPF